jgi:gamma-glutamylcyclotransferase (GGCT)/AIG2-like uncharacterized protein YtfP
MANPSAKNFVQNALDDHFYTPDLAALYTAKWHPLFVYGTLKKGFSRNVLLDEAIPLGPALTRGTGWAMFVTHHKYPFPVVLPVTSSLPGSIPTAGGIMGEAYMVSPKAITNLDFIESNGIAYQRVIRLIDLMGQNGKPSSIMTAWMYIGVLSHWRNDLAQKGMSACDFYTRKKNPNYSYYAFTRKTINEALRNL